LIHRNAYEEVSMPQPRERQPQREKNRQDQAVNKQDEQAQRHARETEESGHRANPDRYPDQGKQAQKPSDTHYPEQDSSGKAERPDAVQGADSGRPDENHSDRKRNRDDLN
jgi:hypothetical protein